MSPPEKTRRPVARGRLIGSSPRPARSSAQAREPRPASESQSPAGGTIVDHEHRETPAGNGWVKASSEALAVLAPLDTSAGSNCGRPRGSRSPEIGLPRLVTGDVDWRRHSRWSAAPLGTSQRYRESLDEKGARMDVDDDRSATRAAASPPVDPGAGAHDPEGQAPGRTTGLRRTLWVNRRSGVAHRSIACSWLENVPTDRLRRVDVEHWPPKLRLCSTCFPRDDPAEGREAARVGARLSTVDDITET